MRTKVYRIEKIVSVNNNNEYFRLVRDNDSAILFAHADIRRCVEAFEDIKNNSYDSRSVSRVLENEIIVKTIGSLSLADLMI